MFIEHLVGTGSVLGAGLPQWKKETHALKDLLSGGGMWTTENKQINTWRQVAMVLMRETMRQGKGRSEESGGIA